MNIIITGSTGFVGSYLWAYLSETGMMVNLCTLSREELNQPEEDLVDIFMSKKIDIVIHLAGKAHDLKKSAAPEEYYKVNYNLTTKLYNVFERSDAYIFIFMSSVKAVADSVASILTENWIPSPATDYGKSKRMAEEYIEKKNLPTGKSYYILRPCIIHGPGNKGNLKLLYNFAQRGIPYPLAAFENKRSFLSIDNLCFIIQQLLKGQNIPSGIYHLADDMPLSTNRVIELINEDLGRKPFFLKLAPRLISMMAKMGDLLSLPLNSERLIKLTENYVVDNRKIIKALGQSLPLSAEDGLRKTMRSFSTTNDE